MQCCVVVMQWSAARLQLGLNLVDMPVDATILRTQVVKHHDVSVRDDIWILGIPHGEAASPHVESETVCAGFVHALQEVLMHAITVYELGLGLLNPGLDGVSAAVNEHTFLTSLRNPGCVAEQRLRCQEQ